MSEDQITLKSGAMLELKMAPFAKGTKLFKVIASELKGVEIELGDLKMSDIGSKDINSLKNVFFQLIGSDALEAAFFDVAGHSLHDGQRITRTTFEPEKTRGDYLPTAWEVIKFNVAPFFSGLDLSSLTKSSPKPVGPQ